MSSPAAKNSKASIAFARRPSRTSSAVLAPLILPEPELTARAPALWRIVVHAPMTEKDREQLAKLLEYWFIERFRALSIEEIRKMLQTLTPLQETRAYQEIFAEGELEGKAETLKRLLAQRFHALPPWAEQRIAQADADQLDHWFDRLLKAKRLEDVFDASN